NTLLREFAAVPGMPETYRRWQEAGAAFHYVSASPWQLSESLCTFLGTAGLPAGSMHLKLFRLKDSTPLGRLPSRKRSKRRAIEQILGDFPGRRFLLVGGLGRAGSGGLRVDRPAPARAGGGNSHPSSGGEGLAQQGPHPAGTPAVASSAMRRCLTWPTVSAG
ncbi:MAG: DUF2183 domain-containing protein, partial [Planctomycetia bacterium]|nr:DUF2183 domain-containing protein [Planctomycetia bacterium]